MSSLEKQLERLLSKSKDYTYDEAKNLLNKLGFVENNKGKTSGSRIIFYNDSRIYKLEIHKPHPKNILKPYQVHNIIKFLKERNEL